MLQTQVGSAKGEDKVLREVGEAGEPNQGWTARREKEQVHSWQGQSTKGCMIHAKESGFYLEGRENLLLGFKPEDDMTRIAV